MCANIKAVLQQISGSLSKLPLAFTLPNLIVHLLIPEFHALPFQYGHRSLIRELLGKVDSR